MKISKILSAVVPEIRKLSWLNDFSFGK